MRIFGIDFTSAPRKAKPITCAVADLTEHELRIAEIEHWPSFAPFDAILKDSGSWVAGIDLPLGQPRRLVEALNWPTTWEGYVNHVGTMSKTDFVQTIVEYSARQPAGDKHHRRSTDTLAQACSPMMMYGVPVGKMFYEGATRIASANVSVLPCRPLPAPRTIAECYPAILVRMITDAPYKRDEKQCDPNRAAARQSIMDTCRSEWLFEHWQLKLNLSNELAKQIVNENSADSLDAMLCAIQVAAGVQRGSKLGIPDSVDALEGWILHTPE